MIDTHVHLDDPAFDEDREEVIQRIQDQKMDFVVNIGSDLPSSIRGVDLARDYDFIYAAIGVHPHEAKTYGPEVEEKLRALAQEEKVVALGEIGLDYFYDYSPREVQREVFQKQLDLAHDLGLPIVIHSREATKETFDIIAAHLDKYPEDKVNIHCFSGSVEVMEAYVKMGCFIALGGTVTFKNAKVPKEVAKKVPLDHLLLETDCPYLTPEPKRGKRNEPVNVFLVADYIANLRGMSLDELLKVTDQNARRFYGIKA